MKYYEPCENLEKERLIIGFSEVPTKPPDIGSDEKVFLKPGDWLNLNCTSEPSRPPTRLTWFVNGVEVIFF